MDKNIVLNEPDVSFYQDCLLQLLEKEKVGRNPLDDDARENGFDDGIDCAKEVVIEFFSSLDVLQPVEGDLLSIKFKSLMPER